MIYINKYKYILIASIFIVALSLFLFPKEEEKVETSILNATVISSKVNKLTVRDDNNLIYTFDVENNLYEAGENLIIEYTGLLDENLNLVNITPVSQDEEEIAIRTSDSMFNNFKTLAENKVNEMTLDEKIGQILLVRYESDKAKEAINTYKVGGFVFFEKDFKDKTTKEVQDMMTSLQAMAKIPLLTAVDEEGGDVVRVSSNKNLIESEFLSPRELYLEGGFDLISEDTKKKSNLLENLGLNVNLAPVVDVSTNSTDYMYDRTLGEGSELTSTYSKTVIEASKANDSVSYVMKHFPGYGNNEDTHDGQVIDSRTLEEIKQNDLPPFEAGIASGAEAILVSHNIVQSIDQNNPASLSASVHNLLRGDLGFTGVIITDDLAMAAVANIEDVTVKALLAGNDIIITTDYEQGFNDIKQAVEDGTISESLIDEIAHKIISWKYYKGLMYDKQK